MEVVRYVREWAPTIEGTMIADNVGPSWVGLGVTKEEEEEEEG